MQNPPLTKNQLIERGVAFAEYLLPSEAEWEYAAKAMIGVQYMDENQEFGRIYPWDGRGVRYPYNVKRQGKQGDFLANLKRGRGDFAGIAGSRTDDGEIIPTNVYDFPPNDFGLYDMSGNVAEWTESSYFAESYEFVSTMNPNVSDRTNQRKVVRGGSWKDVGYMLQVSTRDFEYADSARSYI
jgi:gliding motility-associated lipoprotein GldJ